MESWQADILAVLEAGPKGWNRPQGKSAKAYGAAVVHIGLTGSAVRWDDGQAPEAVSGAAWTAQPDAAERRPGETLRLPAIIP